MTSPETPWCYGQPGGNGYVWIHYEWLDLDAFLLRHKDDGVAFDHRLAAQRPTLLQFC